MCFQFSFLTKKSVKMIQSQRQTEGLHRPSPDILDWTFSKPGNTFTISESGESEPLSNLTAMGQI